ncbi:MAG TPA: cellulose synthase subunit BcsC-related outer membrane protein [Terracidiphilus sp.]|nr:cellulose synthase subunit BcsC-related outer membrane protein [Terracidiphilus sp.]
MPAYGPDPYLGSAPVVGTQPQSYTSQQPDNAPDANPAIRIIPSTQAPNQQLFHQQSAIRETTDEALSNQSGYAGLVVRDAVYRPSGQPAAGQRQGTIAYQQPVYGDGDGDSNGAAPSRLLMAQYSGTTAVPIVANPPRSMASDAWKGLVFSLMAENKNAEALETLNKIPPDVRRQLEADIEFVQGVASLYVAVGDAARAADYLNRVENYYLVHRASAPAGLEIQHAWLLYNVKDDFGLYPVLSSLDSRTDLTAAQRQQVETLWADWAVRRATTAMDTGNVLRGVQLLQAASLDYPDNMDVRKAVAGAYARVGRAKEAVTLFKAIPMDNATPGDYEGAISAALEATDIAQAETWLRQALAHYPGDPRVLGLAARFEQARGHNERAADYWRAALAKMPPDASVKSLDSGLVNPPGAYQASAPGGTRRLLDPHRDAKLPPLPAYGPQSQAPVNLYAPPVAAAAPGQWREAPSDNSLPMPAGAGAYAATPQNQQQGTTVHNAPVYVPKDAGQANAPDQPIFINQSATQEAVIQPAVNRTRTGSRAHSTHGRRAAAKRPSYAGGVNLPPSEQTVDSAEQEPAPAPAHRLRILSEPMSAMAAEVQARFAEETDSQLTQGSASRVPVLDHAPAGPQFGGPANVPATLSTTAAPTGGNAGQYSETQYTPSAQEAATGAYSVPQQQTAPAEKPSAATASARSRSRRRKKTKRYATAQAKQPAGGTLGNAPALGSAGQGAPEAPTPAPNSQSPYDAQADQTPPAATGTGLTDQELEQRNLPPLRGPWVRIQRGANPTSPRDEAEMQLRSIESGYSGWLGGSGYINYRSGTLGYDHLAALEAPFEVSTPLGYHARLTVIAKPVFLDSGQADGSATLSVLQSTTGGSSLVNIPEPIGTLTATDVNPPAQQNAVGIGGEVQLAFPHAAIAGGYTPAGFLVSTFTARGIFRPGNGPITVSVARDSVKDSQLSYAGLRDPAGNALGHLGQIWGGVVANQGNVQYVHGDGASGFYLGAGGQYLTGYNVENNTRVDGNGGAYWRVLTAPEYGTLSIGVNFFAMHYANNQNAFTHGMGGYFSPQGYFLGNVPFTFVGHYLTNWHYNVVGGLGAQAFQENRTPLWPLAADKSIETSQNNPMLPDKTSVGPNYDLRGQAAYQIGPHWFAGGFFSANNTRNYTSASTGFFIRYMFREQPSTAAGPTGIFPTDGLRPFTVP